MDTGPAEIGVAVLTVASHAKYTKVMLLDGLSTKDRPASLGYFMMDTLRRCYRELHEYPQVTLNVGTMTSAALKRRMDAGQEVYVPAAHGEDIGEVYRVTVAVENGDWGLFNS